MWWDEGALPKKVTRRIQSADVVLVSAASAWEIAIKAALGKIAVDGSFEDAVADYGFRELPVLFRHAELVQKLPPLHRDPFDRMLVAQALVEGLTLVTRDEQVAAYAAPTAWE